MANPYQEIYDAENNYIYDYDIRSTSDNEPDPKRGFNILEERNNTSKETVTTAINSIFNVDLRFNDHWKVTSQVGLQWEQSKV